MRVFFVVFTCEVIKGVRRHSARPAIRHANVTQTKDITPIDVLLMTSGILPAICSRGGGEGGFDRGRWPLHNNQRRICMERSSFSAQAQTDADREAVRQ